MQFGEPGSREDRGRADRFPTLRHVVAIDPTAGNRLPPPVVLEEAWANQLRLERSDRTSIPPGNNTLDFRFTALSFSAPDKVRFKYRLDPYEKEWVDWPRRNAHYTNMDPGEYSFFVTAANDYGIWNEHGTSVRFVLQPHYYQTTWFRALCGMILFTLLWAAYQLRVRQLHHQFERTLNARVDERTRIARDLHDTLLQSAHGMLLRYQTVSELLPEHPAAAKERLDHAIAQTADFITEARDQVQGLRTSTVETNDLALAISTLGEELPTGSTSDRRQLSMWQSKARREVCIRLFVTRSTRLLPKRCGTRFGTPRRGVSRLTSAMTTSNSDCGCGTMEEALIPRCSPPRAVWDTTACAG